MPTHGPRPACGPPAILEPEAPAGGAVQRDRDSAQLAMAPAAATRPRVPGRVPAGCRPVNIVTANAVDLQRFPMGL